MKMDANISNQFESRLKEFISQVGDNSLYHERLAAELGALPLFVDWEQCWAIRPNGEIISFTHDDSFNPGAEIPNVQIEDDPRWRNLALFQGAKKYPELGELISAKPDNAIVCPHCQGLGEFLALNPELKDVVCYCGGLGWLPKGYEIESCG